MIVTKSRIVMLFAVCFVLSSSTLAQTSGGGFTCLKRPADVKPGRKCRKSCLTSADCKGRLKQCLCDDACGMSCYNPEATCPLPGILQNGFVSMNSLKYGSKIQYSCDDDHTLVGSKSRTCRSDRQWSGEEPVCINFSHCGESTLLIGKVVGGTDAKEGAWPWQVSLIDREQGVSIASVFGSASVIHEKWILTAAHVFLRFRDSFGSNNWIKKFLITAGISKYPTGGRELPSHGDIMEPAQVILHEKYNHRNNDFDIALIKVGNHLIQDGNRLLIDETKVSGSIGFTQHIRPVCLPCFSHGSTRLFSSSDGNCKDSIVKGGLAAIVTGFGETGTSQVVPNNMQQGDVQVVERAECLRAVEKHKQRTRTLEFTERMLCARGESDSGDVDACFGDSGGPLVATVGQNDGRKTWLQIGITSWGFGCGLKYPGYYTAVTPLVPWILKIVSQEDSTNEKESAIPSEWGEWSICTKSCETGQRKRARYCTNRKCGGLEQTEDCNTKTCPEDTSRANSKLPVSRPSCGRTSRNSDVANQPWRAIVMKQVLAGKTNSRNATHIASGVIVNENWILTAAHPLHFRSCQACVFVVVGTASRELLKSAQRLQSRTIHFWPAGIIIHPQYSPGTLEHDVALMKIGLPFRFKGNSWIVDRNVKKGKIPFSDHIQPICVPCFNDPILCEKSLEFEAAASPSRMQTPQIEASIKEPKVTSSLARSKAARGSTLHVWLQESHGQNTSLGRIYVEILQKSNCAQVTGETTCVQGIGSSNLCGIKPGEPLIETIDLGNGFTSILVGISPGERNSDCGGHTDSQNRPKYLFSDVSTFRTWLLNKAAPDDPGNIFNNGGP